MMREKMWIAMVLAGLLLCCAGGRAGEETVLFGEGTKSKFAGMTGVWLEDGGKFVEMSDCADPNGRPLFATTAKTVSDNLLLSASFEVYDGMGETFVSPAWTDGDNYVAAVWLDTATVRIVQMLDGKEKIVAEKKMTDKKKRPPLTLGAAVSGRGVRAFVDGELALEAAAVFSRGKFLALGGRGRQQAITKVTLVTLATDMPWSTNKSALCPVTVDVGAGRSVFYRKEEGAQLKIAIKNRINEPLEDLQISMTVPGGGKTEKALASLAPLGSEIVTFDIPTARLRADLYSASLQIEIPKYKGLSDSRGFRIVNRPNDEAMPVMMWGGMPKEGGAKLLAELGFTHCFAGGVNYRNIFLAQKAGEAVPSRDKLVEPRTIEKIEEAMAAGLRVGTNLAVGHYCTKLSELYEQVHRIKREGGKSEKVSACPNRKAMREYSLRCVESLMQGYGEHPAFAFALLNTEVRDGSAPCFCPECTELYKQETGLELAKIPTGAENKNGYRYQNVKDFPVTRIVPDNDPAIAYLKWYWKSGDGWVNVNDAMHDALAAYGRKDFFDWHDPAVRVAPVYGSGGKLDMIGQWTYSYPDPIRVAMTADQLINMAQGKQKIYQMIQAICYRSQTAPKEKLGTVDKAEGMSDPWDDHDPEAAYITPAPAQMRIAFWADISRPIDMIGYHGIGALVPGESGSYVHTHPDTAGALKKIHAEIIQPYGPMLRRIGDRPADVAFLESFASQVYSGNATFGWASGEIATYWLATQRAGLQSDMIFDETVMEQGLDKYKILILSNGNVLTQGVYDRILAFQKKGGIVIGSYATVPGIKPDLVLAKPEASQQKGADFFTEQIKLAGTVRDFLQGKYEFFAYADNPEIMLHTREKDGVQYVFAINDKREYGDYFGLYGMVMENGLPASSAITIRRAGVKVIDLVSGREIPVESDGTVTRFNADFAPADGKIFAVMEKLPAALEISAPEKLARGKQAAITVSITDRDGKVPAAVLPLDVRVYDSAFREAECSGYYYCESGRKEITLDLAANERPGLWRVEIRELLTGLKKTAYITIE